MVFNTGYLCLQCGSRRVYASLTKLGNYGLMLNLKCGKCGSHSSESIPLIGDLFDFRNKEDFNKLSVNEKKEITDRTGV